MAGRASPRGHQAERRSRPPRYPRPPGRFDPGGAPQGLARDPGTAPRRPLARAAYPDHVLDHSLVVLGPGEVCHRPPRAAGDLVGRGAPARDGTTAVLVRD